MYPESVLALAGRGVLLARNKKRDDALADARAALMLDVSPSTLYQVACIYSLTSIEKKDDRLQAIRLLSAALRGGYGLDIVDSDSDFDPIRKSTDFKDAVTAAKLLVSGPAQKVN